MRSRYFLGLIFCITVFFESIFAASIDGTTSVQYTTTHQVFHNGEYATGYVKFNSGATILEDATASLNILVPFSGALDLRGTGTLNLLGDLYLDANCTISGSSTIDMFGVPFFVMGGGIVKGNGNTIFMNGDFTIPDLTVLHINSGTIIDGQGHNLIFGHRGRIFVDSNVTLTLCNMQMVQNFNDVTAPCIGLAAFNSQVVFKDVELALSQDFLFEEGQFFVHGDVIVTGTSAFIYRSTRHSYIEPNSTLYFDKGTTFSVAPNSFTDCALDQWPTYTSNKFVLMSDKTSNLFLNEASLFSTTTGCRFTKGSIRFLNQCFFKSNSAINFPQPIAMATSEKVSTAFFPDCVSWSPNGSYIAVVDKTSNVLQIFDSSFVQIGSDLVTGVAPVTVSWSNTSTQLVVANSGDNSIKIFNFDGVSTPALSASASTGTNPSCCAWSSYGGCIAVTNLGSDTLQIFKADTLSLIGSSVTGNLPSSVAWATGDRFLAVTNSGSNTLQIFSFDGDTDPAEIAVHSTGLTPSSVSWAQNGIFLSVANSASNSIQIFSFDSFRDLSLIDTAITNYNPISAAWSLNGRYLAFVNYASDTFQFLSFFDQSFLTQVGGDASIGSTPEWVAWSPVDDFVAVVNSGADTLQVFAFDGSTTPTIVGWNAYTGSGSNPMSVSWSPNGQFISVVNNGNDTLQVYSFDGIHTPSLISGNAYTGSAPESAAWSPVDNFIAVVNSGSDTLQVFSFDETRTTTLELVGGDAVTLDEPTMVSWSQDGRFIAVINDGSSDRVLRVFSFNGSDIPSQAGSDYSFGSGPEFPRSVSWSPDGRFICVGTSTSLQRSYLYVFSFDPNLGAATPTQVCNIEIGAGVAPRSVSWSPDGRFIGFVDSTNDALNIYSFNGVSSLNQVFSRATTGSYPKSVAWTKDGDFIAVVNNGASTLQVFSPNVVSSNTLPSEGVATQNGPFSLAWSPDNTHCVVASCFDNGLQKFEVQQTSPLIQFDNSSVTRAFSMQWSPSGHYLAESMIGLVRVNIWNESGRVKQITSYPAGGGQVVWAPDERYIAIGGSIFLFGELGDPFYTLRLISSISSYESKVAWSPDGRYIASPDGSLKIYSFDGLSTPLFASAGTGGTPTSVAWSPDPRFIAVVNKNPDILQVYSFLNSGSLIQVGGDVETGDEPVSVAWSPDGRFIAVINTGSSTLQVFAFDGNRSPVLVGKGVNTGSTPTSVVWSPDGRFIGVGSFYSSALQIFAFDPSGLLYQVGGNFVVGGGSPLALSRRLPIAWSPDGKFIGVANCGSDIMRIYKTNYVPDRSVQAISNGVVFGDSAKGSDYDAAVSVLAGSNVLVDGKVNYDCVN